MLYGYIGKDKYKDNIPDFIDGWFSVRFEPSWADSGFMGRCIREIDKSEYLPPYNVISPVFGSISLDMLSGGTKTLIQIDNMPDNIFLSSYLGDNCVPLLFDIAQRKDVKLLFNHCLDIGDRDVYFPDFDVTVHSTEGLAQFLYEHRDVYKKGSNDNCDHRVIKITASDLKWEIPITGKFNIIAGESATGKSSMLKYPSAELRSGRNCVHVDSKLVLELMCKQETSNVGIIDGDFFYALTSSEIDLMLNSNCCFVIIARDFDERLPVNYENVYILKQIGKHYYCKRMYPDSKHS